MLDDSGHGPVHYCAGGGNNVIVVTGGQDYETTVETDTAFNLEETIEQVVRDGGSTDGGETEGADSDHSGESDQQ